MSDLMTSLLLSVGSSSAGSSFVSSAASSGLISKTQKHQHILGCILE